MNFLTIFFLLIISLVFSLIYFFLTKKFKIYDKPTRINVHKKIVPKGIGIVISLIFSIYIFYIDQQQTDILKKFLLFTNLERIWPLYSIIFISGIFYFIDDLKNLNPLIKLIFQFFTSFCLLAVLSFPMFISFLKIEYLICIILMSYFFNIFNFIDGFDGMFSLSIFFILLSINFIIRDDLELILLYNLNFSLLIFLIPYSILNKTNNYKIFLGDSGAIPIGMFLTWELIILLNTKYLLTALLIFLYPFLDVTITLLLKVLNKKNIFSRDFDYFFLKKIKIYKKSHQSVFFEFLQFYILNFTLIGIYFETGFTIFAILSIIINFWMIIATYKNLNFLPRIRT